jgi:hypothetical protein
VKEGSNGKEERGNERRKEKKDGKQQLHSPWDLFLFNFTQVTEPSFKVKVFSSYEPCQLVNKLPKFQGPFQFPWSGYPIITIVYFYKLRNVRNWNNIVKTQLT